MTKVFKITSWFGGTHYYISCDLIYGYDVSRNLEKIGIENRFNAFSEAWDACLKLNPDAEIKVCDPAARIYESEEKSCT